MALAGILRPALKACTLAALPASAGASLADQPPERARLIVLTDIGNEPDDAESMVRLLVHANDIEIVGLVATTSRHLPRDPTPRLIAERIDAYGQVLANLRQHSPRPVWVAVWGGTGQRPVQGHPPATGALMAAERDQGRRYHHAAP